MPDKKDEPTRLRTATKRSKKGAVIKSLDEGVFCSFCGKERFQVAHLIAGRSVLICNECIAECNRLLDS